jgi:hypothetical protein
LSANCAQSRHSGISSRKTSRMFRKNWRVKSARWARGRRIWRPNTIRCNRRTIS